MRATLREMDVRADKCEPQLKVADKERSRSAISGRGSTRHRGKVPHRQGRGRRARFADGGALDVAMPPIPIRRGLFRADALLVVAPGRTDARALCSEPNLSSFPPTIFLGWVKASPATRPHARVRTAQVLIFGRPPSGPRMTRKLDVRTFLVPSSRIDIASCFTTVYTCAAGLQLSLRAFRSGDLPWFEILGSLSLPSERSLVGSELRPELRWGNGRKDGGKEKDREREKVATNNPSWLDPESNGFPLAK
ncbi:hypothetical protein B0H13DRAFT_2278833 [Mycena leptocephala]|nr:hypothetical protein B0H13DRAFT_2278833 [Mycena leptocephala]